ncbi:hypothetical protein MP638_002563 [Amoeboaphelidium occidentale]|nr:hypothetical protein MP638_002563 [Amoeboaphelidium occidentale]
MEEEALKRKQRLAALRNSVANGQGTTESEQNENDVPKFKTIEDEAKEIAEEIKEKVDQLVPEEVDITSLIPKKVDWDLKRNIEAKMEKLERITEKKINELIKMKIRENTKPENADIKNEVLQDD